MSKTTNLQAQPAPVAAAGDASLVSVVIATHNRPQMLREALDAALAQDYVGPVEVIVVFDKTQPDTSLVIEDTHRRVSVIANTRTPGLAGARNSGIEASHGKYVAFCDDDDLWLPSKLRRQVQLLEEGDALTAVSGIVIDYGEHSNVRIPQPQDLSLRQLVRRRVMEAHPSSVIVQRAALTGSIGLIDEQMPGSYGEDFDWILRAVQAGQIAVADQALVRVRWGNSQFSQRWDTIVAAIDYGLAKHAVLSLDPRGHARLLGRRAFALAALGRRREALHAAVTTLRRWPLERRGYLALAVAARLVSAERLLALAHRFGRGI